MLSDKQNKQLISRRKLWRTKWQLKLPCHLNQSNLPCTNYKLQFVCYFSCVELKDEKTYLTFILVTRGLALVKMIQSLYFLSLLIKTE